jgi:hypothetical protein
LRFITLPVIALALIAAAPAFSAPPPPNGFVTSVTAGDVDPNGKIPQFNGVPGAGVDNYDVALPMAVLLQGGVYIYCVSMQDLDFTGKARFSYTIKQDDVVIVKSKTIKAGVSLLPGVIEAWCIPGAALPSSPGEATLTGTVTFDTVPATVARLSLPIVIQ